jgi:hypothetical protein
VNVTVAEWEIPTLVPVTLT